MSAESSAADRVALGVRLQELASELAHESVARMYAADPFWIERFGERGRRFALEDANHHVAYLAEALVLGSPDTLRRYARWLQTVLTTRGMCSKHLSDHYDRLVEVMRDHGVDADGVGAEYLQAAKEALLYDDPAARDVQLAAMQLAIAEYDDGSGGTALPYIDHPAFLLSYLADAIVLGTDRSFRDHVTWVRQAIGRHGRAPSDVDDALDAVARIALPAAHGDARVEAIVASARGGERPS